MTELIDMTSTMVDNQPDCPSTARKNSRVGIGETTMQVLRFGGSMDVSSSEYAELRNYVYGINGRY